MHHWLRCMCCGRGGEGNIANLQQIALNVVFVEVGVGVIVTVGLEINMPLFRLGGRVGQ